MKVRESGAGPCSSSWVRVAFHLGCSSPRIGSVAPKNGPKLHHVGPTWTRVGVFSPHAIMFLNFEKPSPNYNVVRAVFVAKRLEYLPIGSLSRVGRDQRVPRAAIEVRSDCWMVFYFHLFPIRQTVLKIWRSSATTCGTVAAVRLIASRFCAFRSICLRSLVVGGKRESWECKANPTGNRQIGANINDGGDDDYDDDDDEEEDQEEEAEEEEDGVVGM